MINEKIVAYMISEAVTQTNDVRILTDKTKVDSIIIDATLQDTSELNRNKRKYPHQVITEGLNRENVRELIKQKSWVGEAGHPIAPTLERQMAYFAPNLSHKICNWREEGSLIKGHVESLPTARGIEFRDMIRQGMIPAFSLRALGPIKETNNGKVVCSPLTIITYDWVFFPSHRQAYMTSIVSESSNLLQENSNNFGEEYCVALMKESAVSYIKNESKNYKMVLESLEFEGRNVTLSENFNFVTVDGGDDKIIIPVEKAINTEISTFFNNFR